MVGATFAAAAVFWAWDHRPGSGAASCWPPDPPAPPAPGRCSRQSASPAARSCCGGGPPGAAAAGRSPATPPAGSSVARRCPAEDCETAATGGAAGAGRATTAAVAAPSAGWGWSGCRGRGEQQTAQQEGSSGGGNTGQPQPRPPQGPEGQRQDPGGAVVAAAAGHRSGPRCRQLQHPRCGRADGPQSFAAAITGAPAPVDPVVLLGIALDPRFMPAG